MLNEGWILELYPGESQTVGRKPMMLGLNPDGAGALGIELGRGLTRFVYTNLLASVRAIETIPRVSTGPEDLTSMVEDFLDKHGLRGRRIIGVGVAAPGACLPNQKMTVPSPDLGQGWALPHPQRELQRRLGLPVYIANDANAAALAETWFGVASHAQHVAFILADVGLGAGLAIGGSIYEGSLNKAGEFSHMIVDLNGNSVCDDGHTGCVESEASAKSIFRKLARLREVEADEDIEHVVERACRGEEPDATVVDRAFRYLAAGVANLVRTFDPDVVVLGGRLVLASHPGYERLKNYVETLLWPEEKVIACSRFGLASVAIGAASLVLQTVYDHTQLVGA